MKIPDDVLIFKSEEEGDRCDFCNGPCAPPDEKDYVCGPVTVPGFTLGEGVWTACGACAKLIDSNSWEALSQRAAQRVNPALRDAYLIQVRRTHQEFAKHRRLIQ